MSVVRVYAGFCGYHIGGGYPFLSGSEMDVERQAVEAGWGVYCDYGRAGNTLICPHCAPKAVLPRGEWVHAPSPDGGAR